MITFCLLIIAKTKVKMAGLFLHFLKTDIMFFHLSELPQPPGVLRNSYYGSQVASAKFAAAAVL